MAQRTNIIIGRIAIGGANIPILAPKAGDKLAFIDADIDAVQIHRHNQAQILAGGVGANFSQIAIATKCDALDAQFAFAFKFWIVSQSPQTDLMVPAHSTRSRRSRRRAARYPSQLNLAAALMPSAAQAS